MEEVNKGRNPLAVGGVVFLILIGCSNSEAEATARTCESLIPQVIQLSEDQDVKILEISSPETSSASGEELLCYGTGVWSDGDEGTITYGTEISPGGNVMIGYKEGRETSL